MISSTASFRRPGKLATLAKLAIAGACLVLVTRLASPAEIWRGISALSLAALLSALVLHTAIMLALAWRWATLVRAVEAEIGWVTAVRMTFVSTVLNLTLPTSVGGDIGRVLMGRDRGIDLMSGSAAAFLDRGIGLVTLASIVAISAAFAGGLGAASAMAATLIFGGFMLVIALRLAKGVRLTGFAQRLAAALRVGLASRGDMLSAHAISLAGHLAAALLAWVLARGMNLELPVVSALMLFPPVLLATAIPISIGGWGVRELAAIPMLALAGLSAQEAAAVALTFGLTQLVTAAIGSVVVSCSLPRRPVL